MLAIASVSFPLPGRAFAVQWHFPPAVFHKLCGAQVFLRHQGLTTLLVDKRYVRNVCALSEGRSGCETVAGIGDLP